MVLPNYFVGGRCPHLIQGIQEWHTVIGNMRKKVDISPFEIAADVGHGIIAAGCAWRFKGNGKEVCRNDRGFDLWC